MKIEVAEDRTVLLKEIYCNTVLETAEGNQLAICMRDDTIELNVVKLHPCWHRVNMQTGEIFPMVESTEKSDNTTKAEIYQSLAEAVWHWFYCMNQDEVSPNEGDFTIEGLKSIIADKLSALC
ncbi:MAG: hypothetical protein GY861_12845 [bacterium]|nr:hypothetical protein [bacterium]